MKNKNYKISSLVSLYLNYIFQKTTLIILSISLLLMAIILIILSNPSIDNINYLFSYKDIHKAFFEQAIFVINIFNGIIVTTIVISLIINSISFDNLFVSYVPRYIICISKIITAIIILALVVLFEVIILFLIPLINYDLYNLSFSEIKALFLIFEEALFELMLEITLTTIVSTLFVPMAVLFLFLIINIIIQSVPKSNNIIGSFIPILEASSEGLIASGIIVGIIWIILLSFLYFSVYNVKDLKLL